MRPPKIALIIDNPFRDLAGMVLVAWELCQKGAVCILIPSKLKRQEVFPLAPDLLVLNYLRVNNADFTKEVLGAGIAAGVFETEAGVMTPYPTASVVGLQDKIKEDMLSEWESHALTIPSDEELRYRLSFFCSWNESFRKYAAKEKWYLSSQMKVTGAPRLDFFSPLWKKAAHEISPFVDQYKKPLVLITTSYTLGNPKYQSPEQELEQYIRIFSMDREFMTKWQQAEFKGVPQFAELANELAKRHPGVTFVLRPHPFEDEQAYLKLLHGHSNLHVSKEGTVDGWLLRASALIHLCSSTSVEAGMVNVPALIPGWVPRYMSYHPTVDAVSTICSNLDEMSKNIDKIVDGTFTVAQEKSEIILNSIEKYFYRNDGLASRRVAGVVMEAVNSKKQKTKLRECSRIAYGLDKPGISIRSRLLQGFVRASGKSVHWNRRQKREILPDMARWENNNRIFKVEEVNRLVNAISKSAPVDSQKISVLSAQEAGAYHFGYKVGRGVVMAPTSHLKEGSRQGEIRLQY